MVDERVQRYIDGVMSGEIITCEYVKLAVARHVNDLNKQNTPDFPYYFNEDKAAHRLKFYKFCRHYKGEWAKKIIEPSDWQCFIKWVVYGWLKVSNNKRRFTIAYVEVARKNGKSTDEATDGLYGIGFDNEEGPEVYTAAKMMDQAKMIFEASQSMLDYSPDLRKYLSKEGGKYRPEIVSYGNKGIYKPLGKSSHGERKYDGLHVSMAIIDEFHAHSDAEMFDVLRSGMGSRLQSLMWIITTAGFEKDCPCYTKRETYIKILKDALKPDSDLGAVKDESVFAIIYTLDDGDDPFNEKNWIKANPNLILEDENWQPITKGSVYLHDLKNMARAAQNDPLELNNFLTKRLNIWTQSNVVWIMQNDWDGCGFPVDLDALKGRSCFGAFDLSETTDFTAWALCFPPVNSDDKWYIAVKCYIPQVSLGEKITDKFLLNQLNHWINQGFVITTDGNTVDYDIIEAQIEEDSKRFNLESIGYDPHNASQIVNNLTKKGYDMVQLRQGYSMSSAVKDFRKKVLDKDLAHGNNPVMNWMIGCAEIHQSANGNDVMLIKPDYRKSTKRIDGVDAAVMAVDIAVRNTSESYEYTYGSIISV